MAVSTFTAPELFEIVCDAGIQPAGAAPPELFEIVCDAGIQPAGATPTEFFEIVHR